MIERQHPKGIKGNVATAKFPILKDRNTFKGREKRLKYWVGDRAFSLIERLQPFNDSRGSSRNHLMFLHDFDNIDKHRLLLPALSIADSARISAKTIEGRKAIIDGNIIFHLKQFSNGALIAQFKVRNPQDVQDLQLDLTFQVIFRGQPGPLFVVKTLEDTIKVVESVGTEFAHAL